MPDVPFSTEQALLHMARLLSQMNRDIVVGNGTDLNLLLALLANVFQQQKTPAGDNTLRTAFLTSASHASVPEQLQQQCRMDDKQNGKGQY